MAAIIKKEKKIPMNPAHNWEELLVDKALARIHETNRQINESAERFEREMMEKYRQINESAGRFERRFRDSAEQTDREITVNADLFGSEMKGTYEQTGHKLRGADGQPGKLSRYSVDSIGYVDLPNLTQKFQELGFVFERSYKDAVINDKKNHIFFKIDITLESGDRVMIIEAKARPSAKDITGHLERMKKVRQYGDLHGENRKFLGAISGMEFNENEKQLAMKNGFYVIEQSGDKFTIAAPEGAYSPGEW
jgi:hypothetical protein